MKTRSRLALAGRLEEAAQGVGGARRLISGVEEKQGGETMSIPGVSTFLHAGSDAILHTKVRLALLDALGADALRLEIDVNDGNVSIAGKVRAGGSREVAGDVVRGVAGVKGVRSHLDIATEGSNGAAPLGRLDREVSDRKLEARVRLNLLEEVGALALMVGIRAADGVVALYGQLNDRALRAKAEGTVKAIEGVTRVINDI